MSPNCPALAAHDAVAVIDMGTNSIRMEIAELHPQGEVRVLDRARRPVFLGQDTFVGGTLSSEKTRAVISILRDFMKMLQSYAVRHVRVLASSAVHEAANADTFIDRVYMATGLEVELVEPLEELRLTSISVRAELGDAMLDDRPVLILDVGGGNALLAVVQRGLPANCRSYPIGAFRMLESLGVLGERADHICDLLRRRIAPVVSGIAHELDLAEIERAYVVGGEMRFLASLLPDHQPGRPMRITREHLDTMIDRCSTHKPERLTEVLNLPYEESLSFPATLLIYRAFLDASGAEGFLVASGSMRDGAVRELSCRAAGITDPIENEALIQTSRHLADKYMCDMPHVEQVARLALSIFDQLQPLHGLSARHRVMLHVAGLVHDVGTFISSRAHHKHGYYIIANSEFLGLSQPEKEIVAQVSRYHRRSCPKPSHRNYVVLDRHRRMLVNKLAAILRVADALDRSHSQPIQHVAVEVTEECVHLNVECHTDIALEKQSLRLKGNLFTDVFGLSVQMNLV